MTSQRRLRKCSNTGGRLDSRKVTNTIPRPDQIKQLILQILASWVTESGSQCPGVLRVDAKDSPRFSSGDAQCLDILDGFCDFQDSAGVTSRASN